MGIIIFQNGRCFPLVVYYLYDYLIFRLIKEALFSRPKRLSQSNQKSRQGIATGTRNNLVLKFIKNTHLQL
jgi:hypothetical protein